MAIPYWGLNASLVSAHLLATTASAPPASWKVMAFQRAMPVPLDTVAGSVNSVWTATLVTLSHQ